MKLRKAVVTESDYRLKATLDFEFPVPHERPDLVLEFYWNGEKWLCLKTPRFSFEEYVIDVPLVADQLQIVYRLQGKVARVDTLHIERETQQVMVRNYKAVQS